VNKTLITRRSLVCGCRQGVLALVTLVCLGQAVTAQTTTTSALDSSTPLGIARGTPTGAYGLSGFESVNLYNGNLNFRLPLLHIGGRGGAQTALMAALNLKGWHVKHSTHTAPNGDVTESFAPDQSWWGLEPGYGPGVLQGRQSGVGITSSCPTFPKLYTNTITRLTFTASDGTEYELRDQATNGQPEPVTTCSQTGFNRGTIFITADGTAATFVSDAPIADNAVPQGLGGLIFPSGNLFMRDGSRYRIVNGLVNNIRDRNGNLITFSYDGNSRVTLITDSLNRQVTINYAVSEAGFGIVDQIVYTGFGGAQRIIRVAKYDHLSNDNLGGNRFRPGVGYSLQTYGQLFPELNGSQSTVNDSTVLGAVYLPDGRSYQFYYNPYGELERIIVPTGGAIEYRMVPGSGVYPTFPDAGDYQINRRVAERLVFRTPSIPTTPEQHTIYTPTYSAPYRRSTVVHFDNGRSS
jgi:YD repeat-containing protein